MNPASSIYVARHTGMVGSAVVRRLQQLGFHNLILPARRSCSSNFVYSVSFVVQILTP